MTWEEISKELFEKMTAERFTVDSDGQYWDRKSNKYVTIDHLFYLVEKLEKENEQLKQDNNALIHLLENQSMIIEELHSKLLEYQVKEPIALTKKDLELMDKAISYYTHGRCGE